MAVFVFAQVMMAIPGALMGDMPSPEGGMLLMMVGSLMGHIICGIVVAVIIRNND